MDKKQNDQPVVPPPDYVPQSEISQESGLQNVSDPLEPETLQPFPEEVLPHSMSNIQGVPQNMQHFVLSNCWAF